MKIFFLLFLTTILFSQNILKREYFINNDFVMLSDIVKSPQIDKKLFILTPQRHTLRIKTKEVLNLLHDNGYKDYTTRHRGYIQFTKRSPIEKKRFQEKIRALYKKKYKHITISSIEVTPNRYMQYLPKSFTIHFEKNSYLRSDGTLYIQTPKKRKIFFHYTINASLRVYRTKKNIQRGEAFSSRNCQKDSIILDKFRAMPLQEIEENNYQSRHYIGAGDILTQRDIAPLDLIKRGERVNVFIYDANIEISFSAKALQSGKLGDSIEVLNRERKRIDVVVTGKKRAEVR